MFDRKYVQSFAKFALPLTNLTRTRRNVNVHSRSEKGAPVLVKADIQCPFLLNTDASQSHVGEY